jgi:hypothetical protein
MNHKFGSKFSVNKQKTENTVLNQRQKYIPYLHMTVSVVIIKKKPKKKIIEFIFPHVVISLIFKVNFKKIVVMIKLMAFTFQQC